MTPRPYAPETRSVPLTWLDCDEYGDDGKSGVCFNENLPAFTCKHFREMGWCPRGFP